MIPVGSALELTRTPTATLSIIGINVLVFIAEIIFLFSPENPSPEVLALLDNHLVFGPATTNPLSAITAMFLHADLLHLVFNMLFLWTFGAALENRIGAKNFLIYYFGAGLWAHAFWIIAEVARDPGSTTGAIGASGAVSGIIALYLYRCFYSKIRMIVTLVFLPWKVNIPAAPLIILWFSQDVIYGIADLSQPSGVAHWAHVGGFVFGLLAGRIKRYGHEGRVEHLNEKLLERLRSGDGWKSAEQELKKLVAVAPRDPTVHHELARAYAQKGDASLASEHFQHAVHRYFLANPQYGAFAVIEHADTLGKPMALHYHVKAGETLVSSGFVEDAYRALLPLVGNPERRNALAERALALFMKVCHALGKAEEAEEAWALFRERFPGSRLGPEIEKARSLEPGKVFTTSQQTPAAASRPESPSPVEEDRESAVTDVLSWIDRVVSDPVFLLPWIVSSLAIWLYFGGSWFCHVIVFMGSFLIAAFYVSDWTSIFRSLNAPSEKKRRKEVDISLTFDRASLAERGEEYQKAAELYEKGLALDPGNVQARFSLARIYTHRLLDSVNALRHCRFLVEHVPPSHPYHGEAQEMMRILRTRPRVDSL